MKTSSLRASASTLIQRLAIIPANIVAEAMRQPQLFVDAAEYRVLKMQKRSATGAIRDFKHARLAQIIRAKHKHEGRGFTEGALKERLARNKDLRASQAAHDRAYEEEEFSKLLLEAYRQRSKAIDIVFQYQQSAGKRGEREIERLQEAEALRKTARKLARTKERLSIKDEDEEY